MKKKRVLIPISFSFSIRYIVRSGLIYKLKEFCEPVIVLTWNEKELIHELNQNNIEVHVVQESERGIYYSDVRKKLDYWFRHKKLQSPTWKIEPRYLEQFSKTNSIIVYASSFITVRCKNRIFKTFSQEIFGVHRF